LAIYTICHGPVVIIGAAAKYLKANEYTPTDRRHDDHDQRDATCGVAQQSPYHRSDPAFADRRIIHGPTISESSTFTSQEPVTG